MQKRFFLVLPNKDVVFQRQMCYRRFCVKIINIYHYKKIIIMKKVTKKLAIITGVAVAVVPTVALGFLWLGLSKTLNGIKIPYEEYENE